MKLDVAIDDVERAEMDLAKALRVLAERHAVEHDLYHLGHALAQQCVEQVDRLRPFADRYGATNFDRDASEPGLVETLSDAIRQRRTTPEFGWGEAEVMPTDHTAVLAHAGRWDRRTCRGAQLLRRATRRADQTTARVDRWAAARPVRHRAGAAHGRRRQRRTRRRRIRSPMVPGCRRWSEAM